MCIICVMLLHTAHTLVVAELRDGGDVCTAVDTSCALDGVLPDTIVSVVPSDETSVRRLAAITDESTATSLRALLVFADHAPSTLRVAFSQRDEWAELPGDEPASIVLTRRADTAELRLRDAEPHITLTRTHEHDSVALSFHTVAGNSVTFSQITLTVC